MKGELLGRLKHRKGRQRDTCNVSQKGCFHEYGIIHLFMCIP